MSISKYFPAWLHPTPDSEAGEDLRRGHNPWLDGIHLVWSIWIFFDPLMGDGFSWHWLLATLITYPMFVLLYALCIVRPYRTSYRYAWLLLALACALMPFSGSHGCVYFVFATTMLRQFRRSLWSYLGQLLGMFAVFAAAARLNGLPWQVLAYLMTMATLVAVVVNAMVRSGMKDQALRLSQEEVRRLAATAERERIGRDLHDLLGHTLSLITLKLELSRKLFERDPHTARREMEEAEQVARKALAEVRAAVSGIRATDLAAELASARLMLEAAVVALDVSPLPTSMPPDVERALALIIREAVTNIQRHAGATRASVTITIEEQILRMRISDNGRGGQDSEGNGIRGMRERIAAVGGTLSIESPARHGTHVDCIVPLALSAPVQVAA